MSNVVASLDAAAPVPESWPLPMPLPDTLPPVQTFTPDLLPESLRAWAADIAHRMQCPPDFPAVGAVVAASSLIGARAVVQPKARDDWQVVPNLWGLAVGNPSVKKSPALAEALKPLHRLQADEAERHQAEREVWEVDCKVNELRAQSREKEAREAVLKSKDYAVARAILSERDETTEPVARRFVVNDTSVEKLGELLAVNPWGTLAYRDEIYGLLTGMDKQGQEGARAFYLQSYDGDKSYTFDRIGRGTKAIPRVCLAMIGGIQPGRLQDYIRAAVSGGSGDDGLLQRFALTVWPDVSREVAYVDSWPDAGAKERAWAVFERLAQLQPAGDTEPQVWRFDADAQDVFAEWLVRLDTELVSGELHPALVFALVDTPGAGAIGAPELRRAIAWGQYLRTHAERMYSAATTPETGGAAALLRKIKAGALGDTFTVREVSRKCWSGLPSPEVVRKAADVLTEFDWLHRLPPSDEGAIGRPSERYAVNPAALRGADEKIQEHPENELPKLTKRGFGSFGSATAGVSEKKTPGNQQSGQSGETGGQGGFGGFGSADSGHIQKNQGQPKPSAKPSGPVPSGGLDLFDGDGEVFL